MQNRSQVLLLPIGKSQTSQRLVHRHESYTGPEHSVPSPNRTLTWPDAVLCSLAIRTSSLPHHSHQGVTPHNASHGRQSPFPVHSQSPTRTLGALQRRDLWISLEFSESKSPSISAPLCSPGAPTYASHSPPRPPESVKSSPFGARNTRFPRFQSCVDRDPTFHFRTCFHMGIFLGSSRAPERYMHVVPFPHSSALQVSRGSCFATNTSNFRLSTNFTHTILFRSMRAARPYIHVTPSPQRSAVQLGRGLSFTKSHPLFELSSYSTHPIASAPPRATRTYIHVGGDGQCTGRCGVA